MTDEVTITVTESGPLSVKGPFKLVDSDGNPYDITGRKRVALCRCGASSTKPFCDGGHMRIDLRPTAAADPEPGLEEQRPAALPPCGANQAQVAGS